MLRELTGWLERGSQDRKVRVVTGPTGAGKSAVLAWLCALSDPQLRAEIVAARPAVLADNDSVPAAGRVSAAVWARDLDIGGAANVLGTALTLPLPADASVEDVLAAIEGLDSDERGSLVVVLDALDEAKAPRDIVRRLLLPLARDLGVKVLTGTRPGRDGMLLEAFGHHAVKYRLDHSKWFKPHDLADYAAACLRADFDPALRSGYRNHPSACGQVARAIADAAGANFLVAGLAARARADEPVIDVSAPGWREQQRFPAEVGEAFDDYLARFGDHARQARDLLRALAYAEGSGLPAGAIWADMASALAAPHRYSNDDLAWLLDSAASYLVEDGGEHAQSVYRIFHQALIEHLRPPGREARAQRELVMVLLKTVPSDATGRDWAGAPFYTRAHLAAHAARAGVLDSLIADPGFLVAADRAGLMAALDSASTARARHVAWFYRTTADGVSTANLAERAAYLQLAAGKAGDPQMAEAFGPAAASWPWTTRVLSWRSPGRYTTLGRIGPARRSVLKVTGSGAVLVITVSDDGAVRLWRLSDDGIAPAGDPQAGHDHRSVTKVAIGQLADQLVAVTGADDGTVQLWRLSDEGMVPAGDPQPGHGGHAVSAVAVGQLAGQLVAVTYGHDRMLRMWRLSDDGVVPIGDPRSARVQTPRPSGEVSPWVSAIPTSPEISDPGISALAVGRLDGRPVAVTVWTNGTVGLWQLGDEGPIPVGVPQAGHYGIASYVVAVGQLDGRPLAVTGGGDSTVRLWRLSDEGMVPVGPPSRATATATTWQRCRQWRSGSSPTKLWRSPAGGTAQCGCGGSARKEWSRSVPRSTATAAAGSQRWRSGNSMARQWRSPADTTAQSPRGGSAENSQARRMLFSPALTRGARRPPLRCRQQPWGIWLAGRWRSPARTTALYGCGGSATRNWSQSATRSPATSPPGCRPAPTCRQWWSGCSLTGRWRSPAGMTAPYGCGGSARKGWPRSATPNPPGAATGYTGYMRSRSGNSTASQWRSPPAAPYGCGGSATKGRSRWASNSTAPPIRSRCRLWRLAC